MGPNLHAILAILENIPTEPSNATTPAHPSAPSFHAIIKLAAVTLESLQSRLASLSGAVWYAFPVKCGTRKPSRRPPSFVPTLIRALTPALIRTLIRALTPALIRALIRALTPALVRALVRA